MSPSIATQLPRPEIDIPGIVKSQELGLHSIELALWKSRRRDSVVAEAEKQYQEWECRIDGTSVRTRFTINGPNRTMDIEFRSISGRDGSYSIHTDNENGGSRSAVEAVDLVKNRYQGMVQSGVTEFIQQSIAEWKSTISLQDVLEYVVSTNSFNPHGYGGDCE